MNTMTSHRGWMLALLFAGSAALLGCGKKPEAPPAAGTAASTPPAAAAQAVKIDGSSTVYPITEAVAEEFQKANKGLKVTVAELKKLWEPAAQGTVTRWNQVNPAWPDAPVKLFGAGADSGTFDYFTEAVVGKAKSSRGDFTASEDDNVLVQGVAGDVNALGFFGYAYYAENAGKLKALPIVAGEGKPAVGPSDQTVLDGTYTPLSRPVFIYVNAKSLGKAEVKNFVDFYLANISQLAKEVKYVPLPPEAYKLGAEHLAKGKKGTVFAGKNEIGIRITDLLKREATL